jgi:hypothetical protein
MFGRSDEEMPPFSAGREVRRIGESHFRHKYLGLNP